MKINRIDPEDAYRRFLRPIAVGVIVVSALLPSGCSSGKDVLYDGWESGVVNTICSNKHAGVRSIGNTWITNTDESKPVVLQSVKLVNGKNGDLPELRGSYIVRSESEIVYGGGFEMPPLPEDQELQEIWDRKENLSGAKILPGEGVLVLLGVHPNGEGTGSSEGFEISYKIGSSARLHRTPAGVAFNTSEAC